MSQEFQEFSPNQDSLDISKGSLDHRHYKGYKSFLQNMTACHTPGFLLTRHKRHSRFVDCQTVYTLLVPHGLLTL